MNKSSIKNFAIWARNKLIADISYRAGLMGITAEGIKNALPQSTGATEFYDIGTAEPYAISGDAVKQRRKLVEVIRQKEKDTDYKTAYKYIIEEVAYTWFNRLIAIRFMEVNDYLPSHVRVLSSETGKLEPDLVTTPFDAELDFTNDEEQMIMRLKNDNQLDELFRMLFIKQCNALNELLPALFEKTKDYTEVLLNLSVIDQEGVVYRLVHDIDEDDFNVEKGGQVEIIGWLYQYYNTEQNELVYDGRLSKDKVPKELLPAATTIYTPDWAVRYMVENSLGRLWIEGHPNDELKANWKYYLEEAEQEPEVQEKLAEIRREYSALNPEDLKCIDPCMGSGHILVYLFDVLMQIYESQGHSQRDAAQSILQNNLYGLDIDDRAAQMAYFAVMMKARQYDRRILTRGIKPHVCAIQESNSINRAHLKLLGTELDEIKKNNALKQLIQLLDEMYDAKEYGSILQIGNYNWELLREFVDTQDITGQMSFEMIGIDETKTSLNELLKAAEILSGKYDVVDTNPPYLGSPRFSAKVDNYVKSNYSDFKADLSMVMFNRAINGFSRRNGLVSFITTSSWMYLQSFSKMRSFLFTNFTLDTMVDFGTELFEGKVGHNPIVSWVTRNSPLNFNMKAVRLVEYCYSRRDEKEPEFFEDRNLYVANQKEFMKIPGTPVAYWVSNTFINAFVNGEKIEKIIDGAASGHKTADNDKYIRFWHEVDHASSKWVPLSKGGDYRKWYGNWNTLLDWSKEARSFYAINKTSNLMKDELCFKEGITWSDISAKAFSCRYMPANATCETVGPTIIVKDKKTREYLIALLNSKYAKFLFDLFNPGLHFKFTDVYRIPVIRTNENQVIRLSENNIDISKCDWDSFENSWDFEEHPFVRLSKGLGDITAIDAAMNCYYGEKEPDVKSPLELCYMLWRGECNERFKKLKENEEELNRIFIDIYGLQNELTPEVEDKDVTVRKADLGRDIRSFISYAVGCMFGRYSLDTEGLAYAGGEWDNSKYQTFIPDTDNVLPITDEEYLEDDIVGLFCAWLKKVFGEDSLEANLDFIAKVLGNKGNTNREVIRNYFLNDFFKDHCNTYSVTGSGKRPIYWLFDSGKQNGFKALVYLHRYTPDTIGNLRVDYLHKMQRIYESEMNRMQDTIDHSTNSREIAAATKRKEKLQKQLKECREYDEKIGHLALSRIELDLDDGVKKNYRKIQTASDGKFYEVLADSKNIMAKEK